MTENKIGFIVEHAEDHPVAALLFYPTVAVLLVIKLGWEIGKLFGRIGRGV